MILLSMVFIELLSLVNLHTNDNAEKRGSVKLVSIIDRCLTIMSEFSNY